MDCAVDAPAAQQAAIGGVDDRVDLEPRDVVVGEPAGRHHSVAVEVADEAAELLRELRDERCVPYFARVLPAISDSRFPGSAKSR